MKCRFADAGADHKATLSKHSGDSAVPEGYQGAACADSSTRHHLHPGHSRSFHWSLSQHPRLCACRPYINTG